MLQFLLTWPASVCSRLCICLHLYFVIHFSGCWSVSCLSAFFVHYHHFALSQSTTTVIIFVRHNSRCEFLYVSCLAHLKREDAWTTVRRQTLNGQVGFYYLCSRDTFWKPLLLRQVLFIASWSSILLCGSCLVLVKEHWFGRFQWTTLSLHTNNRFGCAAFVHAKCKKTCNTAAVIELCHFVDHPFWQSLLTYNVCHIECGCYIFPRRTQWRLHR